jgi:uncharacterized protein YndB with AHSA1/START domain
MPKNLPMLLLAVAAAWFAPSAKAEIKDATPAGFTLENKRVVPVAPEAAFHALVQDVDRWWPKDHSWWGKNAKFRIEPKAGGCFCEEGGERSALHMLVTFVDPPNTLRMTGGLGPLQGMGLHGALEFRFKALEGGSTEITMWYRAGGYAPDDLSKFAPVVDQVQGLQLGGLASFLGAPSQAAK